MVLFLLQLQVGEAYLFNLFDLFSFILLDLLVDCLYLISRNVFFV